MKVLPSILAPLRDFLRPSGLHERRGRVVVRPPFDGRAGPAGPDRVAGMGLPPHRSAWRVLEAARILENPDSSEEAQQAARESLREALRRLLTSGA